MARTIIFWPHGDASGAGRRLSTTDELADVMIAAGIAANLDGRASTVGPIDKSPPVGVVLHSVSDGDTLRTHLPATVASIALAAGEAGPLPGVALEPLFILIGRDGAPLLSLVDGKQLMASP